MSDISDITKQFYTANVDVEWERLFRNAFNRLVYDTTWLFLDRYLPATGLILDAGGGPGRYTIELARRGYSVKLLDLTPAVLEKAQLEIARAGLSDRLEAVEEGSITDLSRYKDNSFDAVLCCGGPLSHVYPQSLRIKALTELVRVNKPGAPLFISVMSKYGVLLATPTGWPELVAYKEELFDELIASGDDYHWCRDAFCHFYTSKELEDELSVFPVDIIQKAGLEGLNVKESALAFSSNYPAAWQKWLEIHREICTDPFVVDASGHMLFIMKKKQA